MSDIPDVINDPAWQEVPPFEVECFEPGNYRGREWTPEMCRQMVDNYNSLNDSDVTFRARVTQENEVLGDTNIGHDTRDIASRQRPALGMVDRLKNVGDKVVAVVKGVPRFMHDCIRRGIFPSVSMEIYRDASDRLGIPGPVPRAMSYLGAEPPELKKLRGALDLLSERGGKPDPALMRFMEDANADANSAKNTEIDIITFGGKIMSKAEKFQDDLPAVPETAAEDMPAEEVTAEETIEDRVAALEDAIMAIAEHLGMAGETAEDAVGEGGVPIGEPPVPVEALSEWLGNFAKKIDDKFSEYDRKLSAGKLEEFVQTTPKGFHGKIRKFAEKHGHDAAIEYGKDLLGTVPSPPMTVVEFSDGSGVRKTLEEIREEMFSEAAEKNISAASLGEKYCAKYRVGEDELFE